jgi:hypothetical protein
MCVGNCFALARWNGCCEDVVAVVVVEDEDTFVSTAGGDIEVAGEVGESFSTDVCKRGEYVMGARIGSVRVREGVGGFVFGFGRGLCGLDALS